MKKYCVCVLCLFLVACGQAVIKKVPVPILQPVVSYDPASEKSCVSLVAVGDVMLGGTALPTLNDKGYDYPFDATRAWLTGADIAVANLETALTHKGEAFDKKYTFRNVPEQVVPAMKKAGFDLVSLANNHSMDYGVEGLEDTLQALDNGSLLYVGAGMSQRQARQPKVIERRGQKIGFLGYSLTFPEEFWASGSQPGTAFGHAEHVREDVALLKSQVDHVVVQFHWGREGQTELRDYQVALGRASINAGASLVLGHHPHILQAIERYKQGVIYYSLGNFAFGSFSNRVQVGGVAQAELCPEGLKSAGLMPVDVNNFRVRFQPKPVSTEVLNNTYKAMQVLSQARQTQLELTNKIIRTDMQK